MITKNLKRFNFLFISVVLSCCSCSQRPIAITPLPLEKELSSIEVSHEHVYKTGRCLCGDQKNTFVTRLPFPEAYLSDSKEQGTLETLNYQTHSYALEDILEKEIVLLKTLNVYLPYNYSADKAYNILYLLHGTDANENYWMIDDDTGKTTKKMVDHMISTEKAEPLIIVMPTYYSIPSDLRETLGDLTKEPYANEWPMYFWQELRHDIIPLIESTYSTYANRDTSLEGLQQSRDHRAFAGLSRGSMTSVNSVMMHCTDLFSYMGSYSGVWADFEAFKETLTTEPFKDYKYNYWYNGNGTMDFALTNHLAFRDNVLTFMPDTFTEGENYSWIELKNGDHSYMSWLAHLYNSLLVFFQT